MTTWIKGNGPADSPWPWLTRYNVTQRYGVRGETGIDIGCPFHSDVNALVGGVVVGHGYYAGGGVVSIETTIAGKLACVYYQHLDLIAGTIVLGAKVAAGDYIGLSGGQLTGGYHPSSSKYSNGAHMEIGINAPYGGFWNPHHLTPNYDPLPWIRATVAAGRTGSAAQQAAAGGIVGSQPGFVPMLQAMDDTMRFHPVDSRNGPIALAASFASNLYPFAARALVVLLGLIIVVAVIWHLVKPGVEDAFDLESQLIGQAGQAAAFAL